MAYQNISEDGYYFSGTITVLVWHYNLVLTILSVLLISLFIPFVQNPRALWKDWIRSNIISNWNYKNPNGLETFHSLES